MSFWIGEKVFLKKSGRYGIIAAVQTNGKIKVKVGEKFIFTNPSNITVQEENEFAFPDWVFEKDTKQVKPLSLDTSDTIDLHIEKLEPGMEQQGAQLILPFQLKKCRTFFEINKQKNKSIVYVICGKGEGVLKSEVTAMAKNEFDARFIVEKNQGGMLEIWL